jgi:hypothetical protein
MSGKQLIKGKEIMAAAERISIHHVQPAIKTPLTGNLIGVLVLGFNGKKTMNRKPILIEVSQVIRSYERTVVGLRLNY